MQTGTRLRATDCWRSGRLGGKGDRRRRLRRSLIAAGLAVSMLAAALLPAWAASDRTAQIARIETYLNGIRTFSARFVQASSAGGTAAGTVYLERPGRMRIDYDPPAPMQIIADGTFLIYYDKQLKQVSYIPIGQTAAGILLDERIRLNGGDLTVTDLTEEKGLLRVTIVRSDNPSEGSLTLQFTDSPLTLTRWQVIDAQGIVTTVALEDVRFGVSLKRDLFRFRDPRFTEEKLQ